MILLLAGCAEYLLALGDAPRPAFDSAIDTDTATIPGVREACNGIDDDADGAVDEGFPDTDGDGVADCVDVTCDGVEVAAPGPLGIRADCGVPYVPDVPVDDPFTLTAAWEVPWSGLEPTFGGVALVAWLDDDDGDGRAGPGDGPELIVPTWGGDGITIVDGATGELRRSLPVSGEAYLAPAVADVDGDGFPEIFTAEVSGRVVAVDRFGTPLWRSTDAVSASFHPSISFTDLEGDGVPELLADDLVLDARTGVTRFRLDLPPVPFWRGGIAVDLDQDGAPELASQGRVFDATGALLWETAVSGWDGCWVAPIQADDDPAGELVWVGSELVVTDTDGTDRVRTPLGAWEAPGAPAGADFDGDGAAEIAVVSYPAGGVSVYRADGTRVWNVPGTNQSIAPGLTAFDFAGDGASEILLPGDTGLVVFDGATGAVVARWVLPPHLSGYELATVADVDEDGHADVIVGAYGGNASELTRLSHAGDGWPPAGARWHQYEFSPESIGDDQQVASHPDPSWLCSGGWRAWPAVEGSCGAPDVVVTLTDVCVEHCDVGPVTIGVQVGNQGPVDADAVVLDLYAAFGTAWVPLGTLPVGDVRSGMWNPGLAVVLPPDAWGAQGYIAAAHGGQPDCDEGNDEADWYGECEGD